MGCARSQSMMTGFSRRPKHLERHVGRHRVDEHEAPVADARGARGVDDDDVGALHAALILLGLLHLELDLGIGLERLLEEQIAGAHERARRSGAGAAARHRRRCRRRGRRRRSRRRRTTPPPGSVNGTTTARRTAGSSVKRLLGQRLAVERERQREGLRLRREVRHRHERLRIERAEVVPPDGQAGDADIVRAPPDADPADPHVVALGLRSPRGARRR